MFYKTIKKIIKEKPLVYSCSKVARNILNLYYFIFIVRYFFHKITIIKCLVFNKNISPDYIVCGGLSKKRRMELKKKLNNQIDLFLKLNIKRKFIYIEVGVYIGQTTQVLGNLLRKKLKNNFQIIAIDPFQPYTNSFFNNILISSIYKYFTHNIKVANLNLYLNHIRMKSTDSLKFLRKNKMKYDFCFIDGSHKYYDVLGDINKFSKIRFLYNKSKVKYKGMLLGDDYELTYAELYKISNQNFKLLNQIKYENINNDSTAYLNNKWFHPGVTFAIKDSKLKIIKQKQGIWFLQ
jgi:hypothetical protein